MENRIIVTEKFKEENPEMVKRANTIARRAGHQKATEIILGKSEGVASYTPYGYRKKTTGEYVPNAYRNNFGWKNTYYQNAETVIMLQNDK
jgi:hypothetical protein